MSIIVAADKTAQLIVIGDSPAQSYSVQVYVLKQQALYSYLFEQVADDEEAFVLHQLLLNAHRALDQITDERDQRRTATQSMYRTILTLQYLMFK